MYVMLLLCHLFKFLYALCTVLLFDVYKHFICTCNFVVLYTRVVFISQPNMELSVVLFTNLSNFIGLDGSLKFTSTSRDKRIHQMSS